MAGSMHAFLKCPSRLHTRRTIRVDFRSRWPGRSFSDIGGDSPLMPAEQYGDPSFQPRSLPTVAMVGVWFGLALCGGSPIVDGIGGDSGGASESPRHADGPCRTAHALSRRHDASVNHVAARERVSAGLHADREPCADERPSASESGRPIARPRLNRGAGQPVAGGQRAGGELVAAHP